MLFLYFFWSMCFANTPSAKNRNMHVIGKYELPNDELEILIDVSELQKSISYDPSEYSLTFQDGAAQGIPFLIEDLQNEAKTTVMLFDDSISMQKAQPLMLTAAKEFLQSLTPDQQKNHTIDILLGALSITVIAENQSIPDALTSLEKIGKPSQSNTALRGMIEKAIEKATEGNDIENGGFRQIIVFSDGLEESDFTQDNLQTLIDKAQVEGVQVHFLFSSVWSLAKNRTRTLSNAEVTKLDRLGELATATGGVNQNENLLHPNGNLKIGARKIAEKMNKVLRIRSTVCEVQKTDSKAIAKIAFKTMDYAYAAHSLQMTQTNTQSCGCPTACSSNEVCKHQICVPSNQPSTTSSTPANPTTSGNQNNTNTKPSSDQQGLDNYLDYWWLPLVLLALLAVFLKFRKKDPISGPEGGDDEDTNQPIEEVSPPIVPNAPIKVSQDRPPAAWSILGRVFQGFPKSDMELHGFTFMHQFNSIGCESRKGNEIPTHNVHHKALHVLEKVHLYIDLLPGPKKLIQVRHPNHSIPVFIENKDGRGARQELLHAPEIINPQTQMLCLYVGNYMHDSSSDDRIFLVFGDLHQELPTRGTIYDFGTVNPAFPPIKDKDLEPPTFPQNSVKKKKTKTKFDPT